MRKEVMSTMLLFSTLIILIMSCRIHVEKISESNKSLVASLLDTLNVAAAQAKYEQYFACFDEDAVFMGTDATERWLKPQYQKWAKPYFDAKQTWNFTSVSRNIYFNTDSSIAWFDELLKTEMKICRGSGVLMKRGDTWRLKQYVLSMTIPNNTISEVLLLKSREEDSLLNNIYRK